MKIPGKQCRSIQPEVNVSDEKITYTFDKSLIFDIGISVAGSSSSTVPQNVSNENKKKCFLCNNSFKFEDLKVHVGKHILDGTAEGRYPCGYCGRESCQNKLGPPTRKNNECFYNKIESNCPFYVHQTRRVKKASNRYPCTNYLNKCVLCKADVWLYNTEHHYEDMHPEAEKPELDPEEVKFMSKKK